MTSLHAITVIIQGCLTEQDQCSRSLKKTACSAVRRKATRHNFYCNRNRVRMAVLKSALLLLNLRLSPDRLIYAGQSDVGKLVTGREITWIWSLHRVLIWNHCNIAKASSWTKNFRLNVLFSENHFPSASCLCCSLQHSANVCPFSEDMKHPHPLFSKRQWRNKSSV